MQREIQTKGGPIIVSGDHDGSILLHKPSNEPASLSCDEARELAHALLHVVALHTFRSDPRTKGDRSLDIMVGVVAGSVTGFLGLVSLFVFWFSGMAIAGGGDGADGLGVVLVFFGITGAMVGGLVGGLVARKLGDRLGS